MSLVNKILLPFILFLCSCGGKNDTQIVELVSVQDYKIVRKYIPEGWSYRVEILAQNEGLGESFLLAKYDLHDTDDDLFKYQFLNSNLNIYYKNGRLSLPKEQKILPNGITVNFELITTSQWLKIRD